jgi:predicted dinucleotide-binding enzyme
MENIGNAKVQKLEAAFTAQMQTLLATQQKTAQNFTTAASADDKRAAAQVEESKGSNK